MPSHTWRTTLDDRPFELRAEHDLEANQLVLWVDGFPSHREQLPPRLSPQAKVVTEISGHRVAVVVIPTPVGFDYQAAIDGVSVDARTPEEALGWVFPGGPLVPARLELAPARYYGCFPRWPATSALAAVASATLAGWATFDAWRQGGATEGTSVLLVLAVAGIASAAGWMVQDLRRQRRRFAWGDVRPGVVVALDPVRVAVHVDLSLDHDVAHPAVRVLEQPLDRVQDVAPGDRLVAAVLYLDSQDGRRWHDADAVAVACGSDDAAAIERLRASVTPGQWEALDEGWRRLGQPTTPGLYTLDPPVAQPDPAG